MADEEEINSIKAMRKLWKANWTPEIHETFLDLCLEQVVQGNKPGTHFTKQGWRDIQDSFQRITGLKYDRKQFKNHWDNTKKQWKAWRKLIGTDYMNWDPNARKFGASEKDWVDYLERNPDSAHFRSKELLFADKLDTIFAKASVTDETEPPARRRRRNDGSSTSVLEMKEKDTARPDSETEPICEAVESRSMLKVQSSPAKVDYSIGECIECLDSMEEVEQGSDLYLFALDVFLKKEYREIFLNLKKPSVRVAWLQRLQSVGPTVPLHQDGCPVSYSIGGLHNGT